MPKWKKFLHSTVGLFILAGVGALAIATFSPDSILGQLTKVVVAAQALLVLGAVNLYIMVKTPMRDVISENADALADIEQKWRAGKLTQPGATFALAAAIEAVGRVLAIMLFAAIATAFITENLVHL